MLGMFIAQCRHDSLHECMIILKDNHYWCFFCTVVSGGAYSCVCGMIRFRMFGMRSKTCTPRSLSKAYRRHMLSYHSDKFASLHESKFMYAAACSQRMSLLINAGKELLMPLCVAVEL